MALWREPVSPTEAAIVAVVGMALAVSAVLAVLRWWRWRLTHLLVECGVVKWHW